MRSCIQSTGIGSSGRRHSTFKSLPLREYRRAIVLDAPKGSGAVGVSSMKLIETAMHESDLFT